MDLKKVLTELRERDAIAINLLIEEQVRELNEVKQKNKKNRKMLDFTRCAFKALYATKKYGCSGIIGMPECLGCEFRR